MSGDGVERSFDVDVYVGKQLDVLALKDTSLEEIRQYSDFLRDTARRLYGGHGRGTMDACPCCSNDSSSAPPAVSIFDVAYVRCTHCGHVFIREQPPEEVLQDQFATSDEHSDTYTDMEGVEIRLNQVARPKAAWAIEQFVRHAGRQPSSAIDVGAGGGHFVAAMKERDIACIGYELSAASRTFARDAFSIELLASSFFEDAGRADIITMWGLLEYVSDPFPFVDAARERLEPDGLLIVEVPRAASLSTAVQEVFSDHVARHLDPTTHVNCFSDASLATLLFRGGFRPLAAWYFGMDVYEALVQSSIEVGKDAIPTELLPLVGHLQSYLDQARCCDDLVLASTFDRPPSPDRQG